MLGCFNVASAGATVANGGLFGYHDTTRSKQQRRQDYNDAECTHAKPHALGHRAGLLPWPRDRFDFNRSAGVAIQISRELLLAVAVRMNERGLGVLQSPSFLILAKDQWQS